MSDRLTDRLRKSMHALREEIETDSNRLSLQLLNKAVILLLENQVELMARLAKVDEALRNHESQTRQIRVVPVTPTLGNVVDEDRHSDALTLKPFDDKSVAPSKVEIDAIANALADEIAVQAKLDGKESSVHESFEDVGFADKDVVEELSDRDIIDNGVDSTDDSQVHANMSQSQDSHETQSKSVEPKGSAAFPEVEPVLNIVARGAIRAFDKRDNIFERGLELLKRWVEPDPTLPGTPFQERPSQGFAYVNVSGLTREKVVLREKLIVERRGYGQRLGRIVHEQLDGDVWLYRK